MNSAVGALGAGMWWCVVLLGLFAVTGVLEHSPVRGVARRWRLRRLVWLGRALARLAPVVWGLALHGKPGDVVMVAMRADGQYASPVKLLGVEQAGDELAVAVNS